MPLPCVMLCLSAVSLGQTGAAPSEQGQICLLVSCEIAGYGGTAPGHMLSSWAPLPTSSSARACLEAWIMCTSHSEWKHLTAACILKVRVCWPGAVKPAQKASLRLPGQSVWLYQAHPCIIGISLLLALKKDFQVKNNSKPVSLRKLGGGSGPLSQVRLLSLCFQKNLWTKSPQTTNTCSFVL